MKKAEKFVEDLEVKKYIEDCIKEYVPILALQLEEIRVIYLPELNATLEIECNYPYCDADIRFGDKTIKMYKENNLPKHRILHELCHLITGPLYCKALNRFTHRQEIEDERERLTDLMSMIIRKLIK